MYIHCAKKHGRTGTIAAILLCMLYHISVDDDFD
jgi:protein-tyrosine phosphatase